MENVYIYDFTNIEEIKEKILYTNIKDNNLNYYYIIVDEIDMEKIIDLNENLSVNNVEIIYVKDVEKTDIEEFKEWIEENEYLFTNFGIFLYLKGLLDEDKFKQFFNYYLELCKENNFSTVVIYPFYYFIIRELFFVIQNKFNLDLLKNNKLLEQILTLTKKIENKNKLPDLKLNDEIIKLLENNYLKDFIYLKKD